MNPLRSRVAKVSADVVEATDFGLHRGLARLLIKASLFDGMLRFGTTIAGGIILSVGRFFRQSKLA